MTTRRIDPDFEERRTKAPTTRRWRLLGATPVVVGLLAGLNGFGYLQAPSDFRRPPLRRPSPRMGTPPMVVPAPVFPPPALHAPAVPAPVVPRMVVPAPAGIDEAMIHQARWDLDPRMVVPAFPAVDFNPARKLSRPLWNVPIPPAPGLGGSGRGGRGR